MSDLPPINESEREAEKPEENPKTKLKSLCMYNGALVAGLVIYAFFGACVFYVLEGRHELREMAAVQDIAAEKATLMQNLWNDRSLSYEEWSKAADEAIADYKGKEATQDRQWGFSNSWLFAWTIFTTIGYGNICPVTRLARLFCMAYALAGIPLFSVVASNLSSLIMRLVQEAHKRYIKKKREREAAKQKKDDDTYVPVDEPIPELKVKAKHVAGGTMGYLIFGTLLFAVGEGWGFYESFYYCFISLTTIGLGDYVPQHIHHSFLFTFYILIGLVIVNCLLFSALEGKIHKKLLKLRTKLGIKEE